MCGTPNHGDAEECTNCGARLKPLDVSGSSGEAEDWLERIREEAEESPPSSSAGGSASAEPDQGSIEGADDFSELRAADTGGGSGSEAESAEEDVPEWLMRVRDKKAGEPSDSDQPAPEDALRAAAAESPASDDPAPEDTLRAAAAESPASDDPAPEDALRAAAAQAADDSDPLESDEPTPEDALRAAAADVPSEAEQSKAGPPEGVEQISEKQDLPEPKSEPASDSGPQGESPDWLEAMESEDGVSEADLPHVPALVGGAEEPADEELGDLGLPDWLGEIEPLEDESASTPQEGSPDLAPATLPNWLEAMRPVDTFRSVVEIEPEDDQAVESVGPLAGLSGVLLAEPVVAMPRTSSVGSLELDVSERQYAQAELLHRLVDEEEQEAPAMPKRGVRLAVFRWAIAAVVLIAVSLPIITGAPSFALPSLEPRELGALFSLVEGLPLEQPVLVVFDYEPGYAGELEAVSGAFLDQMMARGLPLASMSTRPTGSALALLALEPYVVRYGYENGQDIVNLGYLSGGQTAVQLFAISPREAVLEGFALPEQVQEAGLSVWETAVVDQVEVLSDFGMVAVITADSESARVWAEQARPNMDDSPLMMVLSTGAEPLIRPYFESDDPKVGGILSGLPAAVAYELRNARAGLAQERWDAFGSVMLAAELVLLAGVGYGLLLRWRSRSPA